jgi:hypothetical protein
MSSAVDPVDRAGAGDIESLVRSIRESSLPAREFLADLVIEHFKSSLPKTVKNEKRRKPKRLPKIVEKEIREQQMARLVGELHANGVKLKRAEEMVAAAYFGPRKGFHTVRQAWQRWSKKTTIIPGDKD